MSPRPLRYMQTAAAPRSTPAPGGAQLTPRSHEGIERLEPPVPGAWQPPITQEEPFSLGADGLRRGARRLELRRHSGAVVQEREDLLDQRAWPCSAGSAFIPNPERVDRCHARAMPRPRRESRPDERQAALPSRRRPPVARRQRPSRPRRSSWPAQERGRPTGVSCSCARRSSDATQGGPRSTSATGQGRAYNLCNGDPAGPAARKPRAPLPALPESRRRTHRPRRGGSHGAA
jgi:hypothetical protein